MNPKMNPTEMIEPGSARRCIVQGADVEAFEKRGYRAVDAGVEAPEADDLDGLTVPELRDRAEGLGLATDGRKAELIERIRSAPEGESVTTDAGDDADADGDNEGE